MKEVYLFNIPLSVSASRFGLAVGLCECSGPTARSDPCACAAVGRL